MNIKINFKSIAFTLIIFIYSLNNCYSQIKLDSLYFTNKFEFQRFKNYLVEKNSDIINLSIALAGNESENLIHSSKFKNDLEFIKEKTSKMNEKNKLKFIFNHIHSNYLKQYKLIANVNEIFTSGTFNCVSASLVYAAVFNKLKIPFNLKETPTHVYIVAFPKTLNIIVESTDVKGLILQYDEKQKQLIVNDLVDKKLISIDSLNYYGTNKMFEMFMYSDKVIDTTQAIGDLYYNDFITKSEVNNTKQALNSMYKAYLLNPSEKFKYMLLNAYEIEFNTTSFNNHNDFLYLVDYVNLLNNEKGASNLTFYYNNFLVKNIQQKSNPEACIKLFNNIKTRLNDSASLSSFTQFYSSELTKYYLRKNDISSSLKMSALGLKSNQENNELEYFFNESIKSIYKNISNEEIKFNQIDSVKFIINEIKLSYPEILKIKSINENLNNLNYIFLMSNISQITDENNTKKNESDLIVNNKFIEFENEFLSYKNSSFVKNEFEDWHKNLYDQFITYFYKKKSYKYAKLWIDKGLKIYPKYWFLVDMKKTINTKLNFK